MFVYSSDDSNSDRDIIDLSVSPESVKTKKRPRPRGESTASSSSSSSEQDQRESELNTSRLSTSSAAARHRYFSPTEDERKCFKCDEAGHIARECPNRVFSCYSCGGKGHSSNACPDRVCIRCNRTGHTPKECDARTALPEPPMKRSPSAPLDGVTCCACGELGHVNCAFERSVEDASELALLSTVYCCRCAQKGHVFEECGNRVVPGQKPGCVGRGSLNHVMHLCLAKRQSDTAHRKKRQQVSAARADMHRSKYGNPGALHTSNRRAQQQRKATGRPPLRSEGKRFDGVKKKKQRSNERFAQGRRVVAYKK